MMIGINIDRATLRAFLVLTVTSVVILAVAVIGIANLSARFSRLTQADKYVNGAGELESNYQALMNRYFELKKLKNGLAVDSDASSYNARVKTLVDQLKTADLELLSIEYGKEIIRNDIRYLPVVFELSGDYNKVLNLICYIENQAEVMGLGNLEIAAQGASEMNLEVKCTINFYELAS